MAPETTTSSMPSGKGRIEIGKKEAKLKRVLLQITLDLLTKLTSFCIVLYLYFPRCGFRIA